jgi:hypothetical protein
MPTFPWTAPKRAPSPARPVTVMPSRLELRRMRDVPAFFAAALRLATNGGGVPSVVVATWAQVAGAIFLRFVGPRLAHNYRRQIRLKLAERQVDAYVHLWKLTAVATPSQTTPLDRAQRQELYESITDWYYHEGNGIFVPVVTRNLFLAYTLNLICVPEAAERLPLRRGC